MTAPKTTASPPSLYGIDLGIPLQDRRVLIADNSAFNRKTLARFLQWAGIVQVEFADNGVDALKKIEASNPDLVLLDIAMPQMNGIETTRRLRQESRWRDMPILLQSTLTTDQIRTACFQAGATDIIGKPVNPGECIARVRYHLERRQLMRELMDFRERVERDLMQARAMQLALCPEPERVADLARRHDLTVEQHFQTSDEVGGDFWTVFDIDDDRVGLFIADLSGHGITAAINAFRLHTLASRLPRSDLTNPAALLNHLNARLYEILPVGQYATALYGVLDRRNDSFTYAAAGAPTPVLGSGDTLMPFDASGVFLGVLPEEIYENQRIRFPPGHFLFLYSDALVESRDADDRMLGESGLMDLLKDAVDHGGDRPLHRLLNRFGASHGEHPHDDLTAIWFARNGTPR